MARNLRAKIAESDTMMVHDVNPAATKKFAEEVGNVSVGQNVREVAEKTVCIPSFT
jgi:3-hydroxyisobutyrate dehydrogenase